METIEYRTIDKSEWPDGEWKDEPDKIQYTDEETGFPCLIKRDKNFGFLCGYVGLNSFHPFFGKDYSEVDLNIHGGLSFSDFCQPGNESTSICHKIIDGEDDHIWWLGFDCMHLDDLAPNLLPKLMLSTPTYRNLSYVKSQNSKLAKQLKKVSVKTDS